MRGVGADEVDWLGLTPGQGRRGSRRGFGGDWGLLGSGGGGGGEEAAAQDGENFHVDIYPTSSGRGAN